MSRKHGERAACRGCGAPLVFLKDGKGALHPLDLTAPTWVITRNLEGEEVATPTDAMVSHFSVCPRKEQLSKNKKGNTA